MKKKAAALKVIAFKSAFKKLKKELTRLRERVQVLERAVQSQEEDLETFDTGHAEGACGGAGDGSQVPGGRPADLDAGACESAEARRNVVTNHAQPGW